MARTLRFLHVAINRAVLVVVVGADNHEKRRGDVRVHHFARQPEPTATPVNRCVPG